MSSRCIPGLIVLLFAACIPSAIFLVGCSSDESSDPVEPGIPESSSFTGDWNIDFSGSYVGSGAIQIDETGTCSTDVLLFDPSSGYFTNTIMFSIGISGNVEDGVIFFDGEAIGTVTGQFEGDVASGLWETNIPTAGTWTANRGESGPTDVELVRVDVDDPQGGTTAEDWISLHAVSGEAISASGVRFELFGNDLDSRDRALSDPLLSDFVFRDGTSAWVGVRIDGLPAGLWTFESWHHDGAGYGGSVQIEFGRSGDLGAVVVDQHPLSTSSASFSFSSDGSTTYDVVVRAEEPENRCRLNGFVVRGAVTEGNLRPASPTSPIPSDEARLVALDATLSWNCSDPENDPLVFDVYFGTDPDGDLVAERTTASSWDPGTLSPSTTYYWRIIAYDAESSQRGPTWEFRTENTMPEFEMVRVEPGSFTMGSPLGELGRYSDRESQHPVTLTRPMLVMTTEVTAALWVAVMDDDDVVPSDAAVGNVGWHDAIRFCNALSEIEGLEIAYTIEQGEYVRWNATSGGYRLPTEAEWEYACRAGSTSAFCNGDVTNNQCNDPVLDLVGWYCGNSNGRFREGGLKAPNAWGLYDMHGNVKEICFDLYVTNHGSLGVVDPIGGGLQQEWVAQHALRGGAISESATDCRSAMRDHTSSYVYHGDDGFRVVRTVFEE